MKLLAVLALQSTSSVGSVKVSSHKHAQASHSTPTSPAFGSLDHNGDSKLTTEELEKYIFDTAGAAMFCKHYPCPSGWTLKAGVGDDAGYSRVQCCDPTCELHQCMQGYQIRSNPATITGQGVPSEQACCERTCKAVGCQTGYVEKADVESLVLAESITDVAAHADCCDRSCALFDCTSLSMSLISNAENVSGNSKQTCCKKTCASHKCTTTDFVLRADAAQVTMVETADNDEVCCEESCASHYCSPGKAMKANASTLPGSSDAACCE
eukprot:TRINITY_DN55069_c0_g1_i1.p1 TRINITY_DN55069_c0_g1~~TRINITY_DN55069_c0_g1_i1.p1  ORF type:complete len:268 (+),score=41.91 TRINITY_DN55069_c0_g1_i1:67-870(+)